MATATYTSTPRLTVGGTPRPEQMLDLLSLAVEEDVAGLCSLEARLVNWTQTGYRYNDRAVLGFGTEVRVAFGPEGGSELFAGRVSALGAHYPGTGAAVWTVYAEDRLQALRMARRTRTFTDSSVADVASTIASDHGLTASVDLRGPNHREVNQLNLSDLALLRQVADADGGEVWLDGTTLHVQSRADREGGDLTLTYGRDLLSFDVRADLAHQVTAVALTGWSVADKDAIVETGDSSALGAELGPRDGSGSEVLGATLGERTERLVVTQPVAADEARARAKAAYLDRARRFVTGSGRISGNPVLRVGTRVTLAGLGAGFSGDYRVTRTRHWYDLAEGYCTDFDVERAGIGAAR